MSDSTLILPALTVTPDRPLDMAARLSDVPLQLAQTRRNLFGMRSQYPGATVSKWTGEATGNPETARRRALIDGIIAATDAAIREWGPEVRETDNVELAAALTALIDAAKVPVDVSGLTPAAAFAVQDSANCKAFAAGLVSVKLKK